MSSCVWPPIFGFSFLISGQKRASSATKDRKGKNTCSKVPPIHVEANPSDESISISPPLFSSVPGEGNSVHPQPFVVYSLKDIITPAEVDLELVLVAEFVVLPGHEVVPPVSLSLGGQ